MYKRQIWDKYFADAHCIVFVVDSTDTDRFEEAAASYRAIVAHAEAAGIPTLVLANKQDMPQASGLPPIEKAFDLAGVRRAGRPAGILPLCAKSGDGVTDALRWALDTVTEKRS